MRTTLMASFFVLWLLLQALTALGQPSSGAPVAPMQPVGLDAVSAPTLTARWTQGDGAPVRVLGYDAAGRGRAVLALGDPATAANVALLVPGADTDLATLDDPAQPDSRPLGWAQALSSAAGPDTAVVLWVGYETPQSVGREAASGALARAAVPALVEQTAELRDRPAGPPHLTVIGHSYGAVVVALAAPGLPADQLVLLGSPGARADHVTDLDTPAQVFAGRSPHDWIRHVPNVRIGDVGHGREPVDPAFGAERLPADDVLGHDGYFTSGTSSLAAVVRVVTGSVGTSGHQAVQLGSGRAY